MKSKNLTYIVYENRVSSLLVSLPLDIVNKNKRINKQIQLKKEELITNKKQHILKEQSNFGKEKLIPNYLFKSKSMNLFNFVAYKYTRLSNSF